MKLSPFVKQLWVSSGITVNIVGHGCVIGFGTILISQLHAPDSPVKITISDASWLASIIGFALLVGNVISPILMDRYGRKTTHLITICPMFAGWFIILFVDSIPLLILARFFQGISMGMMAPLGNVMIGEFCSPANRGMFLISNSLGLALGVLITHITGTFLTWKYTAFVCVAFTFLSLLIIMLSPETPSWLASKQRYEDCRKIFLWLRGSEDDKQLEELEVMISARKAEVKEQGDTEKVPFKTTIRKKEFYKPILIMFHLYTLFQFSGMNVLNAYTIDILTALLGKGQNPNFWMICLDSLRVATTLVAAVMLKTSKRRVVLFSSGALCILCLLAIALYSFLRTFQYIESDKLIIPTGLILIYMFSLSLGMAPIPFTIAGEIFPVRYRSLGGGISVLVLSLMFFAAVKTAPYLLKWIGLHGTYFVFALLTFYCLAFLWFMLPETKDKTLQEIENSLKGIKYDPSDVKDFKSIQSLHSVVSAKEYHEERRCSQPVIY